MNKKIRTICKECALANNGIAPQDILTPFRQGICDVCQKQKTVGLPKYFQLTSSLNPILKPDRKPKKPIHHHIKNKISFVCRECALEHGGTLNRTHCVKPIKTKCGLCKKLKWCREPYYYELDTKNLN